MTETSSEQLVAPFAGERYADADRFGDLIAPPYDVISADLRETLARRDPHNIVRLILPSADGGDPYQHAAALLEEWRAARVLQRDDAPAVYVVQQSFTLPSGEKAVRTGMIGAVLADASPDQVKPHERTHAGPKEDRLALLRATSAAFETLLFLTRDDDGALAATLSAVTSKRPAAAGELQGVEVRVWPVTGKRAEEIATIAGRAPLYIADGHHRYETAAAYGADNPAARRVPALIVPMQDPGLVILATHRLVRGGPIDPDRLMDSLRDRFQIRALPTSANYLEELASLRNRGTSTVVVFPDEALALLLKGGASLGDLPFAHEPAVAALDVARIDEIVVKRLLEWAGEKASLDYTADAGHVIDAVQAGQAAAGVLVNPTSIEQLVSVADAGSVMPPKATYFMPKVPSGLVGMSYAS